MHQGCKIPFFFGICVLSQLIQEVVILTFNCLQELSTTFITPETLEAAIDHALANPVDYNYAIDLKGNKFPGRDTPVKYEKNAEKASA